MIWWLSHFLWAILYFATYNGTLAFHGSLVPKVPVKTQRLLSCFFLLLSLLYLFIYLYPYARDDHLIVGAAVAAPRAHRFVCEHQPVTKTLHVVLWESPLSNAHISFLVVIVLVTVFVSIRSRRYLPEKWSTSRRGDLQPESRAQCAVACQET